MLRNLKEFHYPQTVPEALSILERYDARAAVVAGGTSLGRLDDAKIEAAVDITRMGLSFIKEDKVSLRVGATTTMQTMARSRKLQTFGGGLLAKAAAAQPSRLLRNGMTLGGATVLSTPWAELPPSLLALDAQMIIAGKVERIIPMEEFVAEPRYRQLGRLEILTEVRIPRTMSGWLGGYELFSRSRSDPAFVIVAVALEADGDGCTGARIVLGGVTRRATRFPQAEKKLVGKKLTVAHFDQAAKAAVKEIDVISDWRSSREYRQQIAHVMIKRTLAACWESRKGESA